MGLENVLGQDKFVYSFKKYSLSTFQLVFGLSVKRTKILDPGEFFPGRGRQTVINKHNKYLSYGLL